MNPSSLALRLVLAVAGPGLLGTGALAQTLPTNPDSAFAMMLDEIRGEDLTLDEAVAEALVHATDLAESEAALLAAEGALRREQGAFDPVLFADLTYGQEDVRASNPFQGAEVLETKALTSAAGARMRLPVGTELEAVLESARDETNSAFDAVNPRYTTQGRLSVRQPLLKGFGQGASGLRESAERSAAAARARYSEATLAVEAEVTSSYWDLYAAERDLAVQRLIAERADAFLVEATRRSEAGLVGPNEVATARVFLTEQRLNELDNEERLDEISDRLVTLVGRAPRGAERFHPTTEPPADVALEDLELLIRRALEWNGEARAARDDLEAQRAVAAATKRNAYPQLDVIGSLGGNGLAGTAVPVTDFEGNPITLDIEDGWGSAVSQSLTGDFPLWSVGVTLDFPLGAREGRGERDRLNAEVERVRQRLIEVERRLREEVRARHREVRHGLRRLELAREGVSAALEQVRIGGVEYENGRTTAFELVRLAADFATAQERYSDALVRTAKAVAELRRLAPPAELVRSTEER